MTATHENTTHGPDFSHIDSREKAIKSYTDNELVKIHLMPLGFGGADIPQNVLYVPEFASSFKARLDAMVAGWLTDGKKLSYSAVPDYKGKSFIPSKLVIQLIPNRF